VVRFTDTNQNGEWQEVLEGLAPGSARIFSGIGGDSGHVGLRTRIRRAGSPGGGCRREGTRCCGGSASFQGSVQRLALHRLHRPEDRNRQWAWFNTGPTLGAGGSRGVALYVWGAIARGAALREALRPHGDSSGPELGAAWVRVWGSRGLAVARHATAGATSRKKKDDRGSVGLSAHTPVVFERAFGGEISQVPGWKEAGTLLPEGWFFCSFTNAHGWLPAASPRRLGDVEFQVGLGTAEFLDTVGAGGVKSSGEGFWVGPSTLASGARALVDGGRLANDGITVDKPATGENTAPALRRHAGGGRWSGAHRTKGADPGRSINDEGRFPQDLALGARGSIEPRRGSTRRSPGRGPAPHGSCGGEPEAVRVHKVHAPGSMPGARQDGSQGNSTRASGGNATPSGRIPAAPSLKKRFFFFKRGGVPVPRAIRVRGRMTKDSGPAVRCDGRSRDSSGRGGPLPVPLGEPLDWEAIRADSSLRLGPNPKRWLRSPNAPNDEVFQAGGCWCLSLRGQNDRWRKSFHIRPKRPHRLGRT